MSWICPTKYVPHDGDVHLDPDVASGRVPIAFFARVPANGSGQQLIAELEVLGCIVGVRHVVHRLPDERVDRHSEELAEAVVHTEEALVERRDRHADPGVLENVRQDFV